MIRKLKSSNLLSGLSKQSHRLLNRLLPSWAESRIDSLLFNPGTATKTAPRVPKDVKPFTLNTPHGSVQAFRSGKGPMVVFVHGWGGSASQFFPLMRGLSQCGFSALAFDQLGHGQSEQRPATLQQSIATLNHILQQLKKDSGEGLSALVGHSTGCIAIASADQALINNRPLFLISPVFNYKLFFLHKLARLDLHRDLIKQYAAHFSKTYAQDYSRFELDRNLEKYSDVSVIAHDHSDQESPVSDSIKFCSRHPLTKLLLTREYGHLRILHSESIWHELKSVLNYEDTTINFASKILDKSP